MLALQEDNSILAFAADAEDGDVPIFTMPAPYLVDATDAYSGDVSVSLTGGNGNYTLTYRFCDMKKYYLTSAKALGPQGFAHTWMM